MLRPTEEHYSTSKLSSMNRFSFLLSGDIYVSGFYTPRNGSSEEKYETQKWWEGDEVEREWEGGRAELAFLTSVIFSRVDPQTLSSALSLLASLYCYAELALIQREMLRFVLPAEVGGVSAPTYWFVCGNSRSMIEGNILHIWRAISHDICIQIHQFGLCILRTIILVCVFSMVLWNVFLYNPSFYCGFLNAASTVCCHRNQIKKYLGFKKKPTCFLFEK